MILSFLLKDLPEHFEDNLETWMKNFLILLTTDNKLLETAEVGFEDYVKSKMNFFLLKLYIW